MSSGGGGDTPIQWGQGGGDDDCGLYFTTKLLNPDPPAVAALHAGDQAAVELNEEAMSVLVVRNGQRIGSIGDNVPALIRCIRGGNRYSANVLSIDGGEVSVNVART